MCKRVISGVPEIYAYGPTCLDVAFRFLSYRSQFFHPLCENLGKIHPVGVGKLLGKTPQFLFGAARHLVNDCEHALGRWPLRIVLCHCLCTKGWPASLAGLSLLLGYGGH